MSTSVGIYVGPETIVATTRHGGIADVLAWLDVGEGDNLASNLDAVLSQVDSRLPGVQFDIVVAVPAHAPHSLRAAILRALKVLDCAKVRIVSSVSASTAAFIDHPSEPIFCLAFDLHPGVLSCSISARETDRILLDTIVYNHNWAWQRSGPLTPSFISSDRAATTLTAMIQDGFDAMTDDIIGLGILKPDADLRLHILDPGETGPHLTDSLQQVSRSVEVFSAVDLSYGAAHIAATMRQRRALRVDENLTLYTGLDIGGQYEPLFPLNCELPATISFPGTRTEGDQTSFVLAFVQGTADEPPVDDCETTYEFTSEHSGQQGSTAIHIEITMTMDGVIDAKCRDAETGGYLSARLFNRDLNSFSDPAPPSDASPISDLAEPSPTEQARECPYCAEPIKPAAIKCRHCGEFLEGQLGSPSAEDPLEARAARGPRAIQPEDPAPVAPSLRLFVSHASADKGPAEEISGVLGARGLATWLAARDIQVGDNYAAQIYEAISASSHLLVLLSPSSVASSHVKREVNIAIDRNVPVLPLIISANADFMLDLPADWKYWLGVVQVLPYQGADVAADALMRRLVETR